MKIILLSITAIVICLSSCSTEETPEQIKSPLVIDSLQHDTALSLITKTTQVKETTDSTLEDGWYAIDHNNAGIQKSFYGTEVLSLQRKPFISIMDDVKNIQSELFIDGIDTFRIITFSLNTTGQETWKQLISNPKNQRLYFALNDKLINVFKVFTNTDNTQAYHLNLKLPYGDFTAEETLDIEARIKHKIRQ